MTFPVERIYVPDTNVLVAAYHHYYAPDICPGFWDSLLHHMVSGRLLIIDRVFEEIISPTALVEWTERATGHSYATTSTQPVVDAYRQLIDWVQDNPQFTPGARAHFARVADGWLAAYAMATGTVVVTNEVSAPQSQSSVKLPDLCRQFGVPCVNTFEMLRELGTRFEWQQTG